MLDFIASFYLPSRFRHLPDFVTSVALVALASLPGCRRALPGRGEPHQPVAPWLHASLALVPAEARIVVALDLERVRGSPIGKELAAGAGKLAGQLFEAFATGTGIDLVEKARQVLVAVPGERLEDGRFVVVATFDGLDPTRASIWLRERQDATSTAFVQGSDRLVIAKGAWAAQVSTLAKGQGFTASAEDDPEFHRLCLRAAHDHVFWFAAVVPPALRHRLGDDIRLPDAASVMRLQGSVSLGSDLRGEALAELSNAPDARSLAHRLNAYLSAAKRHPDVLAQGLAPYLEAVRLAARGPDVHASLELPASQAADLAARIADLVRAGLPTSYIVP